jgi:hypothetical protein
MPSAVSPFVTTYATSTPYITIEEFKRAPTALDVSDLVPEGSSEDQDQVLAEVIARASGWADTICNQVLAATKNIERDRYRVNRWGCVSVPLRYKPVLEVVGVKFGLQPSSMQDLTDYSNVVVNKYSVDIPVLPAIRMSDFPGIWTIGSHLLVEVTYINGWCNAVLTGDVIQGATSLPLAPTEGIYPGQALRISDGISSEAVTVASDYAGGSPLKIVGGTAFGHSTGVSISNLPTQVKEAVILLTTALIQTRGDDAIILDSVENPTRLGEQYGAAGTNVNIAFGMLRQLMRAW